MKCYLNLLQRYLVYILCIEKYEHHLKIYLSIIKIILGIFIFINLYMTLKNKIIIAIDCIESEFKSSGLIFIVSSNNQCLISKHITINKCQDLLISTWITLHNNYPLISLYIACQRFNNQWAYYICSIKQNQQSS